MVAVGFKAAGRSAAGGRAESFTARGFGEAAGFAEAACFGDFSCFEEPLKTSDNQLASLAPIGSSTNATIAAMAVRRRGRTSKPHPAEFLADDGKPCFSRA